MNTASVSRPHVLIVDDDEDHCELLELRLQHHGYRATSAHHSRGALETLEREGVDAMVLDLRLEHENGLDLLDEVEKRSMDLPVIILTAHGSIETAVEAIKRGAYGFLTKPYDDRELLQKVEHAIERVTLRREVAGLRRIVGHPSSTDRLLGTSAAIAAVRDRIERVAPTDATVLILGESGTGKEVAARTVHAKSSRHAGPFIAINCGALPPELLESELFGHKKGAFTGASRDKDGLFAAAEEGTLFLDEIGDAPPSVQVKLLRVLQDRTYLPVGATDARSSDVRVLAATNRDLRAEIEAGRFREDLYYRIHVVPVLMPALRERPEDIPFLAEVFLARAAAQHGLTGSHLSHEALRLLMEHDFPGNVRELANVVQGAALLSPDGVLRREHVLAVLSVPSAAGESEPPRGESMPFVVAVGERLLGAGEALPPLRQARETFDRMYLEEALRRAEGNVSLAAKLTGRNRTDLHDLLKRYEINAADFRGGARGSPD
jgi:two-component system, NtrC family, response regulator GlrR